MAKTLEGIIKQFADNNELKLLDPVYKRMREYDRMIKSGKITIETLIEKINKEDKLRPMRGTKEWKQLEADITEYFEAKS